MPISDLEQRGLLRRHQAALEEVKQALARASDELEAARLLVGSHPASAYELAYNAMLFAVSALLYASGYRAAAERHHATLVEFAEERLRSPHRLLIDEFDAARKKRHHAVYEQRAVSQKEARHALDIAAKLIAAVAAELKG